MKERVRITIDFELPNHSLEECCKLVMNQMKTTPVWHDSAGTGGLNYVCYDSTMRVVSAEIIKP